MDRKKYPRGEEEPMKILRRKIRSATWRRNHSYYEKKANERGTTNLHRNWLILFSATKMLSRGAISQLKYERLNKSSNGSVFPTVEWICCYYRCSDVWTFLFHSIFRLNKRDTATKLALRKTWIWLKINNFYEIGN